MSDQNAAVAAAPRNLDALREAVITRRKALPKRLAHIAAYVLANPDDVAFGTVASVAQGAEVQPSALVRFAQTFGYHGFSDLQTVFRDRLRGRVSSYAARLASLREESEETRIEHLFEGFADAAEQSVRTARNRIAPAQIERAARTLAAAETIFLIGQRRSYPVTAYLSYALGKLGIRNLLLGSAVGIDAETASFATERDAALAVSFTPYASTAVELAKTVERQGAAMVVVTDSPLSPIVPESGVCLEVAEADHRGFRTMSATMVLAMTLAVAIAEFRAQQEPARPASTVRTMKARAARRAKTIFDAPVKTE